MKFKINYLIRNILLGFIGLVIIVIVLNYSSILAKYPLIWIAVVLFLLLLFGYLKKRTSKFVSGLVGESDVDRELKKLDKSFVYIPGGLDTGKGNIDKIVIGPTGVWALEVKSHKGDITYDGQILLKDRRPFEKNFLGQAYAEAKTLQERIKSELGLNIPVQPVLVFSSKWAKVRLGLKEYKGVYVIQKGWLIKLLTETHNSSLDINTIKRIEAFLTDK
jgi:hypothetical protein